MAKLYEFGKFGPWVPFIANEGNMTITMGDTVSGVIPVPSFANPCVQEDGLTPGVYVKLTNDMEVTKCAAGDPACIGKTRDRPQWNGTQPSASANWGSYTPRMVTVELFCNKVTMVNLEAANSAVTYGNYIKRGATTAQRFDKSATATQMIALQSAAANSGAFVLGGQIAVMMGAYIL
jgi:hypothetical protein